METTIELSLKDLRIILKYTQSVIEHIEDAIKIRSYSCGPYLSKLLSYEIKEYKEELETMYAYRIYLYTEIEKAKLIEIFYNSM